MYKQVTSVKQPVGQVPRVTVLYRFHCSLSTINAILRILRLQPVIVCICVCAYQEQQWQRFLSRQSASSQQGSGLGQLSSEVLTLGERFSQVFIDEMERGAWHHFLTSECAFLWTHSQTLRTVNHAKCLCTHLLNMQNTCNNHVWECIMRVINSMLSNY